MIMAAARRPRDPGNNFCCFLDYLEKMDAEGTSNSPQGSLDANTAVTHVVIRSCGG